MMAGRSFSIGRLGDVVGFQDRLTPSLPTAGPRSSRPHVAGAANKRRSSINDGMCYPSKLFLDNPSFSSHSLDSGKA